MNLITIGTGTDNFILQHRKESLKSNKKFEKGQRCSILFKTKLPVIVANKTAKAATPVALARWDLIVSLFNTRLECVLINKSKRTSNSKPCVLNGFVFCFKTVNNYTRVFVTPSRTYVAKYKIMKLTKALRNVF